MELVRAYLAELSAQILVGRHTEIAERHWTSQINARKEPAYYDTKKTKDAEEYERTAWASGNADY